MKRDLRPLAIRFQARIEMTPSCWLWTGQLDRYGYGRFRIHGTSVLAHRWSYEQARGPIPDGKQLDHLCRERRCVNPSHLDPVTNRENALRGSSFSAVNAAKTQCPHGHPYDSGNTYVSPNGHRGCRTCRREASRQYQARRRKAARVQQKAVA